MKLIWGKRKYTFVIIPEADQSVIRFRIPNLIAYFIPICIVGVVFTALTLYIIQVKTVQITERLKIELAGQSDLFDNTVASKDQTISQLQHDVFQLSQHANEIKQKVEELKKLESDILGISGSKTAPAREDRVTIASSAQDAELNGVGGSAFAGDDEVTDIVSAALLDFTSLDGEMKALFDGLNVAKLQLEEQQALMRITPSLWPTTSWKITSTFGYRMDPFTRKHNYHAGIDIAGNSGDAVYATADGKVVSAGLDRYAGNNIILNHSKGIRTRYMHLKKILVKTGATVKKGEKIGLLGSTGRSTGPHLHYEVHKNGQPINPAPYMTSSRKDED